MRTKKGMDVRNYFKEAKQEDRYQEGVILHLD
jgi:hypothetical protein